jgi:hypothetical protein
VVIYSSCSSTWIKIDEITAATVPIETATATTPLFGSKKRRQLLVQLLYPDLNRGDSYCYSSSNWIKTGETFTAIVCTSADIE